MGKKVALISAFIVCYCIPAFSLSPSYFVKYFGDSALNVAANGVCQLPGGSIYVAGSCNSIVIGGRDIFLTKFNELGDSLWTQYYGTPEDDYCARIVFTGSCFILCGQSNDSSGLHIDGLMVAIDTSGSQLWLYTYGTPNLTETLSGLTNATDGGIIASGSKADSTGFGNNFWLIKTDSAGSLQWDQVYGDAPFNEVSDAVIQSSDGSIFLSGDKQVNAGRYNAWLVKTDAGGNYLWDLLMDNHNNGGCKNILLDSLNNIIVVGEAATDSSADFDIQLAKADTAGNFDWLRYVRASNQSDAGFDIIDALGGNYVLTGYYYDTVTAHKRIQLMLIDSAGNELNRKLFGSSSINIGYQVIHSVNGGYIICGTDLENHRGILLYDDITEINSISFSSSPEKSLILYPNPAQEGYAVYFSKQLSKAKIELYNLNGALIEVSEIRNAGKVLLQKLSKGTFILNIKGQEGSFAAKITVE